MQDDALEELLRARLRLRDFPAFGGLRLWLAHPGSGLAELSERFGGGAPYWGFAWPGGLALAQHVLAHRELVHGRRVLDFGAGCGIVGIVAHLSGARGVTLADSDRLARAAGFLNAGENGLMPDNTPLDDFGSDDVILAGDVFYNAEAAEKSLKRLRAFRQKGAEVLIGDPFRPELPLAGLVEIARTSVREVGAPATASPVAAGVFALAS